MAISNKKRSWFTYFFYSVIAFIAGLVGLAIFAYSTLPSVTNINDCFVTSMFKVDLCPKRASYVRINQLPKHLVAALIASEDASFYFHKGFDWDEIQDSLEKSMDAGRWVRGGSTITQQLAKNLYLSKDKNILRKMKEFFIAQEIEKKLSKSQIIEKYFNVVEFGKNIYGIQKAASHYFQKSPSQLSPAEGAYLISLLPSPIKYSAAYHSRKELSRFNRGRVQRILSLLKLQGKISEETYASESQRTDSGLWHQNSFTYPTLSPESVDSIEEMDPPSMDDIESPTVDEE